MSNLITMNGIPTFKSDKGFRYPEFWEYYQIHDRMYWNSEEINLQKDISDFKNASDKEKDDITKTMRLFTQQEIQVGYGYATMLRIFKPMEVQAMLSNFMAREFTHIENYSLFTETIGLPNSIYQEFLDIPQMSSKAEYLEKAKVKKYEEYKAMNLSNTKLNNLFRRDIARMLAIYAGGAEAISLLAQFAALLKYQFEGKYPGLCTIVEFSIVEETLHFKGNAYLFRTFISENLDIWDDDLKFDIYQGIREMVAYEENLVDYFDYAHIDKKDLKQYIRYRGDQALKELGMKANWNITTNPLPYMDDVVGQVQTDFFSGRVTDYTKQIQGNWGDINYDRWK